MSDRADDTRRLPIAAGGAMLVLLFVVLTVPVAMTDRGGTAEAYDEVHFHLPTIRDMADRWPRVDLTDYGSATSPGLHLMLAAVSRTVSDDVRLLRVVNIAMGALLVLVVFVFAARRTGTAWALSLSLPLVCSSYVIGGSIWLTTDVSALLFVVLAVGVSVLVVPGTRSGAACGFAAAAAVCVRQVHLWTVAPVALAGLLAGPTRRRLPRYLLRDDLAPPSLVAMFVTLATAALPLVLMALFFWLWGGLTPPAYRGMHDVGLNGATVGFTLALTGGFGVFYLPIVWSEVRAIRYRDPVLLAAIASAVAVTTLVPTGFDMEAGRWGGSLWRLVAIFPEAGGRSLLLPPAAVVGAVTLLVIGRAAAAAGHGPQAAALLLCGLGWTLAQSFDSQCFQRYIEPFVLVLLAWLTMLGIRTGRPASVGAVAGPLALALVNFGLTIASLYLVVLRSG